MSNANELLVNPDSYTPSASNNSITSNWLDKRSAPSCHVTFTLSGVNAPTGTLVVQTSSSPEKPGGTFGSPATLNPPDVQTYPGSTIAITATGTNAWDITTAARWIRVVYTASSSVAGLSVNCYANAPYSSQ